VTLVGKLNKSCDSADRPSGPKPWADSSDTSSEKFLSLRASNSRGDVLLWTD